MKQGEFLGPIFLFSALVILILPLFSHMVPFNQPEAAVVCLRSFFTLPFKPTCLVSHFYSLVYCSGKSMLFLLLAHFFFWQDLITRWIMDIPLLLEPSQAASAIVD